MYTNDNRQNAHQGIDHIFKDLLPAQGMPERPEQIALSHRMLDAMLDGNIALCDAGTGIGKTYRLSGSRDGVPAFPGGRGAHSHFHFQHRASTGCAG